MYNTDHRNFSEYNVRAFVKKLLDYKHVVLISLLFFLSLAFLYIKSTPPIYLVDTTLLVKESSQGNLFGDRDQGSMQILEPNKNLANEMTLLKSSAILESAINDLNFQVAYYSKGLFGVREHYHDFPVFICLLENRKQLINTEIRIKFLDENHYEVQVEEDKEYALWDLHSDFSEEVENSLYLTKVHEFGKPARSDFYHFIVYQNSDQKWSDFEDKKYLFFTINSTSNLVKQYQEGLDINQVDLKSSILNVSIEGESVLKQVHFLNTLTEKYIESKTTERTLLATSRINFIEDQLENVSGSLAAVENSIAHNRRTHDGLDLKQTGINALAKFQELQNELSQANLKKNYLESLLTFIKDSSGINQIVGPAVTGINDPLLENNLLELKRLSSELTRAKYLSGPKSFDLEVLNRQIANTRIAIKENINNHVSSTKMAIEDIEEQVVAVEKTIDMIPEREQDLTQHSREADLFENLYNYLNQELARTGIAHAEELPQISVVNKARMVGDEARSPQKKLILFLSLLMSFASSAMFISFLGPKNSRISGIEMLKKSTQLPVVAQIVSDEVSEKRKLINAQSIETKESLKDLYSNIKYFLPNHWNKVISLTSGARGEGKTFVAINLALTMAEAGNRVLLIDADFKNPTLSRYFSKPVKPEVTLENGHGEDKIIGKNSLIDFVSARAITTNPDQFIHNPKFKNLILGLKDSYDHIIIDYPAMDNGNQDLVLFHLADVHLFVVRNKKSKLSHVAMIEDIRKREQIENLYLILNGVPEYLLRLDDFGCDSTIPINTVHTSGRLEKSLTSLLS